MTREASDGDVVRIQFVGTTGDGEVFSSTEGREPLELVLGEGHVLPGLEEALRGLEPGEGGRVTIPAADAYGELEEATEFALPREAFHPHHDLVEGQLVELEVADGESAAGTVTGWDDETVFVEDRHPLAGKDVTFEFEVVSVEPGPA